MANWRSESLRLVDDAVRALLDQNRQPVEQCWRLRTKSGRILTCAIFEIHGALDVRTFFDADDFLQGRDVPNLIRGRSVAAQWLRTALRQRRSSLVIDNQRDFLAAHPT